VKDLDGILYMYKYKTKPGSNKAQQEVDAAKAEILKIREAVKKANPKEEASNNSHSGGMIHKKQTRKKQTRRKRSKRTRKVSKRLK
jgi:hypothetical protein